LSYNNIQVTLHHLTRVQYNPLNFKAGNTSFPLPFLLPLFRVSGPDDFHGPIETISPNSIMVSLTAQLQPQSKIEIHHEMG
jgi:hypothetical protein